ncbi:MAG: hypothetical protein M5R40_08390 [Anaerolineae bacterium]|nr:hypothetical protein [Anaerolineae bacterium]
MSKPELIVEPLFAAGAGAASGATLAEATAATATGLGIAVGGLAGAGILIFAGMIVLSFYIPQPVPQIPPERPPVPPTPNPAATQLPPQTQPQPETKPEPEANPAREPIDLCTATYTPTPQVRVIVELGAGDYENAIAMKKTHPMDTVIATNLKEDWRNSKWLAELGASPDQYFVVKMYLGWKEAKKWGVQVGVDEAIENEEVRPDHMADLVYTVFPPPTGAYSFGREAARIAKTSSGTTVAATGVKNGQPLQWFIGGFQVERPGSMFSEIEGAPFGTPSITWEAGTIATKLHIVL